MGTGGWVCPPLCDTSMECADGVVRRVAGGAGVGLGLGRPAPQRLCVEAPGASVALPAPLEDEEMLSSHLRSLRLVWPHCADGETEVLRGRPSGHRELEHSSDGLSIRFRRVLSPFQEMFLEPPVWTG